MVGAAPTGDAPTASVLSTIVLPTKVRLILEALWWFLYPVFHNFMTFSFTEA